MFKVIKFVLWSFRKYISKIINKYKKCLREHWYNGKGEILIWTNLTSEQNLVKKEKTKNVKKQQWGYIDFKLIKYLKINIIKKKFSLSTSIKTIHLAPQRLKLVNGLSQCKIAENNKNYSLFRAKTSKRINWTTVWVNVKILTDLVGIATSIIYLCLMEWRKESNIFFK